MDPSGALLRFQLSHLLIFSLVLNLPFFESQSYTPLYLRPVSRNFPLVAIACILFN